jgi:hypothetical protein
VVLVVAGSTGLVERCREATSGGVAAVEPCDIGSAATHAARWRPLVIALTEDVYEFDRAEFDALAKDVGARVLVLPSEDAPIGELRTQLLEGLLAARRPSPP